MSHLLPASLVLALALPPTALAAAAEQSPTSAAELKALRAELDAMRAAYEGRLRALETRLQAAEAAAVTASNVGPPVASPASPPAPAVAANVPAAPSPVPPPPAPTASVAGASSNAFNPAISLILSGLYTRTSRDPAAYAINGFALPAGAEIGPGTRGFSLAETEIGLAASVDPWWRGAATIALHGDNTVSVEEAFIQTTALGSGFTLKAGRFFSGVGYLNSKHAHSWDFVDNPLAYQALLGTQYGDDGVQLKWLAPIDQYLELGIEVGRGRGFPGGDNAANGAGMAAFTAHSGGDFGISHSWRAGVSLLGVKASGLGLRDINAAGDAVHNTFSGNTQVWVADAVWKWAPNGNSTRTSFTLQGEVLRSRRSGSLVYDVDNTNRSGDYRATQSGWYLQGVYQFMPRWRIGLRAEQLDPGRPDYGINAAGFAAVTHRPRKNSLMLDFIQSEFSRLRLQLARDRAREGAADTQLFLQYQMSLGAHGAHAY